jgi:hypothetical protein
MCVYARLVLSCLVPHGCLAAVSLSPLRPSALALALALALSPLSPLIRVGKSVAGGDGKLFQC